MVSKAHCTAICLLLTILALGITTFLLAYTLMNVEITSQSSTMVTRPVNPEDLPYPPMKLCYSHWSAWVNFTAAYGMNFTKPEVLYAMSYLTQEIYSVERFDVQETAESFFRKLNENKLTMTQFFLKTALKFDNIIFGQDRSPIIEHTTSLEPLILDAPLFNQYYVLCYTFADTTIAEIVASFRERSKNRPDFFGSEAEKHTGISINPSEFDLDYGQKEIHKLEKAQYLKHLSGMLSTLKSIPGGSERFPALVYINAYKSYPLVANILASVQVVIKATGYIHKKSQTGEKCHKGKPHFVEDRSCYDKCIWKFDMDQYHCNDSSRYSYYPKDGAHFHFLTEENGDTSKTTEFEKPQRSPRCYPEWQSMYDFFKKGDFQCTKECQQEMGCTSWTYDISQERTPFGGPVQIRYPVPEHTMIMEPVEPLVVWKNQPCFVIGFVGLWFCMVLLSVVQLIFMGCVHGDGCCGKKKSTSMEVLVKE